MIIGFIVVGAVLGAISCVIALFLGAPLWVALGCYAVIGSASVFLHTSIRLAFGASQTKHSDPLPATAVAQVSEPADAAMRPAMRILAVDDDPYILELLPLIATRNGFSDTITAASPAAALDILNADPTFGCLLLDINMPEMDGIELCRHIRAISAYQTTPIIMLTAMRDMKNMGNAFRAGATDYATKPFDIDVLGARLKHAQDEITQTRREVAATHPGYMRTSKGFDMPDNLKMGGMKNLVDLAKLENFLSGISGKDTADVQVFALRADPMGEIYDQVTLQEFTEFLADLANAAGSQFGDNSILMAFDRNGNLLIVTEALDGADQLAMEAAIEDEIAHRSLSFSAKKLPQTMISFSKPVRPNAVKAHRTSVAFGNAIMLAERRASIKGITSEGARTGTT